MAMTIGELAQRTGVAASRIRFYEASGLLKNVDRRANGYRSYSQQSLQTLTLIKLAQKVGFRLDEIQALLPVNGWAGTHDALLHALTAKHAEIERMERRLTSSKAQIEQLVTAIENKPEDMHCDENFSIVMADLTR